MGQGHLDYPGTPFFQEGCPSWSGKTAETGIKRASEPGSRNLRELISQKQKRRASSYSVYRLASFALRIYFVR